MYVPVLPWGLPVLHPLLNATVWPQRGEPAALTTVCLSYCHTGAVWVSGNPQLPQAAAAALQGAARVAGHHGVVREAPSVKRMAAREEPSVQVLSQGG